MAHKHTTTILPVYACEQRSNYDCGPAALRSVLLSLGKHISHDEVLQLCPPHPIYGTPPESIRATMDQLGVSYRDLHRNSQQDLEQCVDKFHLCLVAYQAWWASAAEVSKLEGGHYSVVFGYDKTHFFLADPSVHPTLKQPYLKPIRRVRKDIFMSRWKDYDMLDNKYEQWMLAVPLNQ